MMKNLSILSGILLSAGCLVPLETKADAPGYLVTCANALANAYGCEGFSKRLEWDVERGAYNPGGACADYKNFIKNCVMGVQIGKATTQNCIWDLMAMASKTEEYSEQWQVFQPRQACNTGALTLPKK